MKQKKYQNKFGNQQYDRYSIAKTTNKIRNPNAPRERVYFLHYQFDPKVDNLYLAVQKYQMKA
jgi:hypothetical protein